MVAHAARTARLLDSVYRTFGDADAKLYPLAGGGPISINVIIDRGTTEEFFERAIVNRPQAVARIRLTDISALHVGDVLEARGYRWKVAGAAARPGLGHQWEVPLAEVQAL